MKNSIIKNLLLLSALVLGISLLVHNQPAKSASAAFTMVWSSNSYVPLGYEGKALPSRGSRVNVFLLPTGPANQNPEGLNYRWILDEQIAGYANGRGKMSFSFTASKWANEEHEVRVQVLNNQENVIFESTLYVPVVEPEILIMPTDSAYAVKNELSSGTDKSLSFKSVPFFFHIKKTDELNLDWQLDNQTIASDNVITIKIPAGELSEPLQKTISLDATHKTDQLQQASSKTTLIIE